MTQEEKGCFYSGILVGALTACLLIVICGLISEWKDPASMYHPNALLNSNEYKIDTITSICNYDTTVTYKFVKK